MDVKTLCLGLLSIGEACGYDLKKQFESIFKHFFPAGYGSIYPALADLAQNGLVSCREFPQEGKPDRKIYRITDKGRQYFRNALRTTTPQHKMRSEFLAMLYFADLIEPERLSVLLDERLAELRAAIVDIDEIEKAWDADTAVGARFVAGFGASVARAAADYIESNREALLEQTRESAVDPTNKSVDQDHNSRDPAMNLRKQIGERPWILAVAVSLLVVLWMVSGSFEPQQLRSTESIDAGGTDAGMLTRVQVRTQLAKPITRYISVYGQTEPARTSELSAETEGRVVSIGTARGNRVTKGDIIVQLDLRDRDARLAQAKASVKEHRTSYQGQLELRSQGYVSETQIAETLAKLETAKTELTRAKLDLEYMVVRAPFDGVLQEREVEIGDFVRSGDSVATVVDNSSIIVSGTIAEQDASYVRINGYGQRSPGDGANGHRAHQVHRSGRGSIHPDLQRRTRSRESGRHPAGRRHGPDAAPGRQDARPSDIAVIADPRFRRQCRDSRSSDEYNQVEFLEIELARSDPDGVWVAGLPETARVIIVGQGYVAAGQTVEPVFVQSDTALAETTPASEPMK